MDRVSAGDNAAFEQQMSRRLIERLELDLRVLVYDGANFFTCINSRTPAELPKRGHDEQKRGGLRQISLGLLVSSDFHISLLHWVYAGNLAESVGFRSVTEEWAAHYQELAHTCQHITLVFGKGNSSEEAFDTVAASPFHFVGSLAPSQHAGLPAVSRRRFHDLADPRLDGVEVCRAEKKVFGRVYTTVVVTFNENLLDGQVQGLTANLNKARRQLRDLHQRLRRWRPGKLKGKRPKLAGMQNRMRAICSARHLKSILKAGVKEVRCGLELAFSADQTALDRLCRVQLGKTILILHGQCPVVQ